MAIGSDVLRMLCPLGGWYISGNEYANIIWVDERPRCTETEFDAGFAQYDSWKTQQDADKVSAKAALLARLGLTAEEAKLLVG